MPYQRAVNQVVMNSYKTCPRAAPAKIDLGLEEEIGNTKMKTLTSTFSPVDTRNPHTCKQITCPIHQTLDYPPYDQSLVHPVLCTVLVVTKFNIISNPGRVSTCYYAFNEGSVYEIYTTDIDRTNAVILPLGMEFA
jgi:hypothetical protein